MWSFAGIAVAGYETTFMWKKTAKTPTTLQPSNEKMSMILLHQLKPV